MPQILEVNSGRSVIQSHDLLHREAWSLPPTHETLFQNTKTKHSKKQPQNDRLSWGIHRLGTNISFSFSYQYDSAMLALCKHWGEGRQRDGRHKLQPQHTACATVTPQMLGCSSTHGPSPSPGIALNSPMNLPLQLSSGHCRWCHATQTDDQIFNRSLGRKGQGMREPWNALWSYAPEMTKNEKARQPLAHGEHNSARCLVQDKHLDVWLYVLFFLQMLDYCKH